MKTNLISIVSLIFLCMTVIFLTRLDSAGLESPLSNCSSRRREGFCSGPDVP